MADVRDILERGVPVPKKKKTSIERSSNTAATVPGNGNGPVPSKNPEKMRRELLSLLSADGKEAPPIVIAASGFGGYKQNRINFGQRKVRTWKWMTFNPGRNDNFTLNHWRRAVDEGKEYPFASFGKTLTLPNFDATIYQQKLQCDGWTREESEHLMYLCNRFDLRFVVIADRWDQNRFRSRSIEELKKRYYDIYNALEDNDRRHIVFDADHEKKRKEQLIKLYNRTAEQVEEEQKLLEELRKIETRKKEREKKTQDLQKLIIAADISNQKKANDASQKHASGPGNGGARPSIGRGRKKAPSAASKAANDASKSVSNQATPNSICETAGIKFPEAKSVGATLRSQRMKLPTTVGQKKSKAIEQLLIELNVDLKPMPTEQICQHFNELRSDMVLLYELKLALGNSEFELQTMKHQYEALNANKPLPEGLQNIVLNSPSTTNVASAVALNSSSAGPEASSITEKSGSESPRKGGISEVIDVGQTPGTPNRKRRAALEQGMLMKKLKKGQ